MKRIFGATAALALSGAIWACSSDDNHPAPADGGTGGSESSGGGSSATGGAKSSGGATASGGASASGGATGSGGTTSTGGVDGGPDSGLDGGPPPLPPVLGAQIDRMGRPGVNTALTDPFDIVTGKTEDEIKNEYNAASDRSTWAASFHDYIATNLAIINGLDRNCNNQFGQGPQRTDGGVSRYTALASVLVDDELFVKTDAATCETYLGVEANATGIIANTDCGGRTLTEDVIDTTYSVLAIGGLSGVGDGVAQDDTFLTTFPFLAAPQ